MTDLSDFNSMEHAQKVARDIANQQVRKYFADLPWTSDGVPNADVTTTRSSLRMACYHQDKDPIELTNLRLRIFYDLMGYGTEGINYYLGAVNDDNESVVIYPKIGFYFSQDLESVPNDDSPADMEISFRYKKYTKKTFLPGVQMELAREIKSQFISGKQGIIHTKGKLRVMCEDPENGLDKKHGILSNTKLEGIQLFRKMYAVMDAIFDDDKITCNDPERKSSNTRTTEQVAGKSVKTQKYRPVVNVRFRYAYASLQPLLKTPIFLVDTTYRRGINALVYP